MVFKSFSSSLFKKKPREKTTKKTSEKKKIKEVNLDNKFWDIIGKKGTIHVDWVISFGIFLVYIILLIILIRPGVYKEYNAENLFTIIESNFFKNISINIKEVQFIIEKCNDKSKITLEDLNGNYYFSKLTKEDGSLVNSNGINIGNKITVSCGFGQDEQPPISTKLILSAVSYPDKHLNFEDSNMFPVFKVNCNPRDEEKCKAGVGIITEYVGFNEDYLNQLKSIPYTDISNSFWFPVNKRFNITIEKLKDNNFIEISDKNEPIKGVDIFVKEFNNIYLDRYNNRENIKTRIIVW